MDGLDFDNLGLGLRTVGRAGKLTFAASGELSAQDLEALTSDKGTTATPLIKLRERHHALALGLASGMSPGECSAVYGYSGSRISVLQSDTAFKELVIHYRGEVKDRYLTGHQAMADLQLDAAEELRERMEDKPDTFSHGQLLEIMKVSADRTGLGPSSQTNVDVRIGLGDRMQKAQDRVSAAKATMIDVTPKDVTDG